MGCSPSKTEIFLSTAQNAATLREISVSDIKLDQQPFYDFLNQLTRNHVLEKMEFKNIEIEGDFKKLISLTNTLRYKKTLKILSLINVPDLGEKKGKACLCLVCELPLLETLILKEIDLADADSEYLSQIIEIKSNLKLLDLSGNFFDVKLNSLLRSFRKNTKLEKIYLEKFNMTQGNIDILTYSLSSNFSLTELRLGNNNIGKAIVHFEDFLKNSRNLKSLSLMNCNLNDIEFGILMESLHNNQNLIELYLNQNKISAIGSFVLKAFFSHNTTLKLVYLNDNNITIHDVNKELSSEDMNKVIV